MRSHWKESLLFTIFACFCYIYYTEAQPVTATARSISEPTNQSPAQIMYSRFVRSTPAKISYYGKYPSGTSACSLDPIPPILSPRKWVLAAVSREDFLDSLICGTCFKISAIDLTRSEDPEEIYAAVVDTCNACEKGEINLYTEGRGKRRANIQAIECLASRDQNEKLSAIVSQDENVKKIQIKNSLLPVVGLEMFSQGKWTCLPSDSENHYFVPGSEHDPMQLRATSVTGESIGFSISNAKLDKDIPIGNQFRTFSAVKHSDEEPSLSCDEQRNSTSTRNSVEEETGNIRISSNSPSAMPDQPGILQYSNGRNISLPKSTDSRQSFLPENFPNISTNVNTSFCRGKPDGAYPNSLDCRQFVLCAQGKTLNKRCPNILKFNQKQGSCDWPTNVTCGKDSLSLDKFENSKETDDEEVYTKKFINKDIVKPIRAQRNHQF